MFHRTMLFAIAAVYICLPLLLNSAPAEARLLDRMRARRAAAHQVDKAKPATPPAATTDAKQAARVSIEIYKDKKGEWRWRAVHRNGNIGADSGEGYKRRAGAEAGARSLFGDKYPIHDKK